MSIEKIQEILEIIMRLAAGDLGARGKLSGAGDELEALMGGVNMLAEELEDRFHQTDALLAATKENLATISAQHETILSLSTPALAIWDDVLVLPIIGLLDRERTETLTRELLEQVARQQTRVVIIDVTGITHIDTAVAGRLISTFDAIKLLGARCILTGVKPAHAQNIVGLGVTLEGVTTAASLHAGLKIALGATGV